ncbi:MAG TPA: biotin/lipoate--protein ligase family protein [Pseudolabrys sp.]|jgi:biotin-(acetyl-CoA carboxylase) ligase|nr:biotin/lipoate--protein ligase family protein [Pseudolabrys sp.]
MPLQSLEGTLADDLRLPPPYSSVRLRELGDAFVQAQALAPKHGAGTLVYVGRFDLAEFALVMEPEQPLRQARRVFYAGMAALIDALAATAVPETAINVDWPDAIYVNYGLVGGARLAWPKKAREEEVPPWLVFGAMIRTASTPGREPGVNPGVTALEEEGFAGALSTQLIESFARNFMVALDTWHESGFAAVARSFFERMTRDSGLRCDIDDNGDLLLRRLMSNTTERRELVPRLKQPSWYDAKSKAPIA